MNNHITINVPAAAPEKKRTMLMSFDKQLISCGETHIVYIHCHVHEIPLINYHTKVSAAAREKGTIFSYSFHSFNFFSVTLVTYIIAIISLN